MEEFKTLYLQSKQRANQAIAQIKSYEEKNRIVTERFKAFDTEADETEGETRATHTEERRTLPEPHVPTFSTLRRELQMASEYGFSHPTYRYPDQRADMTKPEMTSGYGQGRNLPAMTVRAANVGAPGTQSSVPMMNTVRYAITRAPIMAASGAPIAMSTFPTTMPVPATSTQLNFTGGIKLQSYKSGNDIEVFIARYDVYCESVNIPEIKKVSCLLNALDETTFRIVSKELPQATRYTIQQIKDYMLQRFQPPQSEGQLQLMFRNCKQEKDQDLQTFYTDLLTKGTKAFANDNIMSMEKNLMDQFIVGLSEEKVRLHLIERRQTLRSVKETLDCAVAYKEALTYKKKNYLIIKQKLKM